MKVDNSGHRKRLRNRYKENGLDGFNEYEVLELVLSYSLVRQDTKQIAKKLLEKYKNLIDVLNAPVDELTDLDGVGERTAVMLKLFRDTMSYALRKPIFSKDFIQSSDDVYNYLKVYFKGKRNEEFMVIYLNSAHRILKHKKLTPQESDTTSDLIVKTKALEIKTLSEGTVNKAAVYIRQIVEDIIRTNAAAVILAHNHPSGSLEVSQEDVATTSKIASILKILDTEVIDHLIIGDNDYVSLRERNLL
ncbi:MAG: JAB domain-containing protein [Candidatus Cloacimonas sp.]|nr:hypothetical protein [Candidatus Cloacimonadota bacterium]